METTETKGLSKYQRKKLRLQEEANYGYDYTEAIEQAEAERTPKVDLTTPANKQKLQAIEKHERLLKNAVCRVIQLSEYVKGLTIVLNATPDKDVNKRKQWNKYLNTYSGELERYQSAVQTHKNKIEAIKKELQLV